MRFHHMALMVSDLQKAIHLWRDVLGFELAVETVIPDGKEPGPNTFMYPELLDDIFKIKGAKSKMALLSSAEGAMIELQECETPAIQKPQKRTFAMPIPAFMSWVFWSMILITGLKPFAMPVMKPRPTMCGSAQVLVNPSFFMITTAI